LYELRVEEKRGSSCESFQKRGLKYKLIIKKFQLKVEN